jgi:hypothetical protein
MVHPTREQLLSKRQPGASAVQSTGRRRHRSIQFDRSDGTDRVRVLWCDYLIANRVTRNGDERDDQRDRTRQQECERPEIDAICESLEPANELADLLDDGLADLENGPFGSLLWRRGSLVPQCVDGPLRARPVPTRVRTRAVDIRTSVDRREDAVCGVVHGAGERHVGWLGESYDQAGAMLPRTQARRT